MSAPPLSLDKPYLDKPYIIKEKIINAPNHPRIPDTSLKLEAIKRCFSLGEGV